MNTTDIVLTDLETKLLHAFFETDYGNGDPESSTWVFDVIDHSGIPAKQARGALASLVKKEIMVTDDTEGYGRPNEIAVSLTALGRALVVDRGIYVVKDATEGNASEAPAVLAALADPSVAVVPSASESPEVLAALVASSGPATRGYGAR